MSTPWRVIDLLKFEGKVSAGKGFLHVTNRGDVALADISAVLAGPNCLLHASVFERAAHFQIPILHCDWRGAPIAASLNWSSNSRVAARHRAQATLSIPRQKQAWQQIIQAKIRNQAEVTLILNPSQVEKIQDLVAKVRSGDPLNIEAQAARIYWQAISRSEGFRRSPGSRIEENAGLDYGYAVLRVACLRSVVAAGLWPSLGIWHRTRDNPFALVDDVIEPFRPAIDLLVMKQKYEQFELTDDHKKLLVGALSSPFDRTGRTLTTCVQEFCQQLAGYVEGMNQRLRPPRFSPLESSEE